ncbi:helix-turn-helix domain-containing protein [Bengtsoniella intestinalis]|uniref:helix-turn-helix domain-containing protein n=1 Tax=Bengtsoniella intestinalis TaxID=3073143 RepID=UPI00391F119B
MDQYERLLQKYPDYISKEQFYKICHISKSTALQLFQSNLVPVIDTKRKTRRYFIAKKDVIIYLRERNSDPEKYHITRCKWMQSYESSGHLTDARSRRIKVYITGQWQLESDVLTVADLRRLLGYQLQTIRKWLSDGTLASFKLGHIYYIPKQYAIDFVGSQTFYAFTRKTKEHIKIMKECSKCAHK